MNLIAIGQHEHEAALSREQSRYINSMIYMCSLYSSYLATIRDVRQYHCPFNTATIELCEIGALLLSYDTSHITSLIAGTTSQARTTIGSDVDVRVIDARQ